jgi:hypothetical protein
VSPSTDLKGLDLVQQVIDPKITEFAKWFSDPKRGNGGLAGYEKEILRAFLWWGITEDSDAH